MKPIGRNAGRSAVAAIAYRTASRILNERDGLVHDFTHKRGVAHAEIVLPDGVEAGWARDRARLWNAAEFAEKRKDARVAREFELALPHELTAEQRLEAAREMARELANRYGAAVDFAVHAPHEESDIRNHHAHILMTTRQVGESGLGEKTYLERENKWLLAHDLPTTDMQLRDLRQRWETIANHHLAIAGLDIRIDHRSHLERGLEIEPTEHMGVHATQMARRGLDVARTRLDEEAAKRNAELIREKPEQVLAIITGEKSVFDRRDVARALHRYINDDVVEFQNAFATVMASSALVELQPESIDPATDEIELARYSTREMIEIENGMIVSARRMHERHDHGVDRQHVVAAIERQNASIQRSVGDPSAGLSDEQRRAIEHVTGPEKIAAVVGFAGAGKSTMLAAAREAWEAKGYRVFGSALSGKAAEGLEASSAIKSRTLASWSRSWENDKHLLGRGDVFVIDEAGMVGSRQLARFIGEVEQRGAKVVLVGDHEQLQAIGAGAPFRAITEEIGYAELSDIRRQRLAWQREASVAFATHKTADGLSAYRDFGAIRFAETAEDVRTAIVRDYLADRDARPDGTRVAMAHRRADVRALNESIRSALQERGELAQGDAPAMGSDAVAMTFQTNDGPREFAPGDRIVFLENNRDLGVKNGMLGSVLAVEQDAIQVQLDGKSADGPDVVNVPINSYQAVDHGYATTIHKNQGATVDQAFVLASTTMDRHLTYVAMTRHRDGVKLYADTEEFTHRRAGRLVEHGKAPFEHDPTKRESYFVTLENDKGERHTVWGVDLDRAMEKAAPKRGAKIGLLLEQSVQLTLPDGTKTHRNSWRVQTIDELAYGQLERRLSRSGVKETTLDYIKDFAERRGIAESFGIKSEIAVETAATETEKAGKAVIPPLVRAVTTYARGIEAVAREKAKPAIEPAMTAFQSIADNVFCDPAPVTTAVRKALLDAVADIRALAQTIADRPETFGPLRGRTGLLGDNKERTTARRLAQALSHHVVSAARAFRRRLEAERRNEQSRREKCDVVEVPGLTQSSERLLRQLAQGTEQERLARLAELRTTPEGVKAVDEARAIVQALERRFGHSHPRDLKEDVLQQGGAAATDFERIRMVAELAERTRRAELTLDHQLKQNLSKAVRQQL
jgi:Ti-type conjugative transfer relaxase TraA